MPETYKWPNDDGLYCKSYCPLHPEIHDVVLALVDEIMDAFEASTFHAGMDEVFYIGDPNVRAAQEKTKQSSSPTKWKLFENTSKPRDKI